MNPGVDAYFNRIDKWKEELMQLRKILLDCLLTEELKWGAPCYTFRKSNIAILGGLKDFCVLSFFKGALLQDVQGILLKPGENTQAARLIRFTNVKEVVERKQILKAYIHEAVELEKAGLSVNFNAKTNLRLPVEFQKKSAEFPALKAAFDALTPGRQRAYHLYFSAPKQSKTRALRVKKCMQRILDGKGLNDRP